MVSKVLHNKYTHRAVVKSIKVSKNKEFFIWTFKTEENKEPVGFTPSKVYFGNKTHQWYSIIVGYYLPHSYNLNFDNAIGKECYVCLDTKGVVRNIVPLVENKTSTQMNSTQPEPEVEEETQVEESNEADDTIFS